MDLIPGGGPGWLYDIFDAKLFFDDSTFTEVPDGFYAAVSPDSKAEPLKAFDGKGAISGKLVVAPPEGREITHNGIEIIFSSNAIPHAYRQEYLTVVKKVWVLLEAGTIAEPIEVGFDIDLAEIGLRDTFDGTIMSFRHTLGFRIVRPWYTFSVRGEEALAIRNCAPPAKAPPPPQSSLLVVDDFGGVATLDHGKCSFVAGSALIGTVTLKDLSTSLAEVALLIGRTEAWATDRNEVRVPCACMQQYKSPLISTLSPLFVSCVPCRTRTSRKSSCTLQSRSPSPPTERSLSTFRSQSTARVAARRCRPRSSPSPLTTRRRRVRCR